MGKAVRNLLVTSVLLFVASWASCTFGVSYDVSQLPPGEYPYCEHCPYQIGDRWVYLGGGLLAVAISISIAAAMVWIKDEEEESSS